MTINPTTNLHASSSKRVVAYRQIPRPGPVALGESERVRLAGIALTAALGVSDVRGADAGSERAFVTETASGDRLQGVSCVAARDGGYDVSLRLVAGPVPLRALGESVRSAVLRSAGIACITAQSVDVHFVGLALTEES